MSKIIANSPHPLLLPLPSGEGRGEGSAAPLGEGWDEGSDGTNNIYKIVNQLEIEGYVADGSEKRIPDGILYINGLPLVVFEFKSAIREEATIHDALVQLTTRYRRDIPQLFVFLMHFA